VPASSSKNNSIRSKLIGAILQFPQLIDGITIIWVSPINLFRRTAARDTELGGQQIAEGDKVVMFYASANRDEDVFAGPQQFDIGRDPTRIWASAATARTSASAATWPRSSCGYCCRPSPSGCPT
jgi:Cytochrome P450